MFGSALPTPQDLRCADDATVVAAVEEWTRIEAAAGARRLDAVAELVRRRANDDDERAHWSCDYWDATAAEVSAAQNISHRAASAQMHMGLALRHRLPQVAALFTEGRISAKIVSVITWRTFLIEDEEALRLIDAAIADRAIAWGQLSALKLEQAIDAWVDRYDPGALRRTRLSARSREVNVGAADDKAGISAIWGRLYSTDASLLDRRLTLMAHEVCDDDPRTIAQRRADALGAIAAGAERLACTCGSDDCPANGGPDERASGVVINVVAEESALDAQPDPYMSVEPARPERKIGPKTTLTEALTPDPEPDPAAGSVDKPPGVIIGGGVVPTPLLAELIRSGAKVRHVRHVGDAAAEPHYRPSAALAKFVRIRDLTCRFPNCDRPAEFCDIDHTIPYPLGPTHASNLKCLCRKHHLLKTFWTGIGGWADQQLADGTVVWTSPTGQKYTTKPGGRLFFPRWDTSSGALAPQTAPASQVTAKGVMMPKRRRTRAAELAQRIAQERALNDAHVAERNRPPPFSAAS